METWVLGQVHARSSYQSTTGTEGGEGARVAEDSTAVVTSSLRLRLCGTGWTFALTPKPLFNSKARSQEATVPLEQQVELPSKSWDPQQHFISILCWRWWRRGWWCWQLRGSTRPLGQGRPVVKLLRLILILSVLFLCCLPYSLCLPIHRGGDWTHLSGAASHWARCDWGTESAASVPTTGNRIGVNIATPTTTTATRWLLLARAPQCREDDLPLLSLFWSMETCGKCGRCFKWVEYQTASSACWKLFALPTTRWSFWLLDQQACHTKYSGLHLSFSSCLYAQQGGQLLDGSVLLMRLEHTMVLQNTEKAGPQAGQKLCLYQ